MVDSLKKIKSLVGLLGLIFVFLSVLFVNEQTSSELDLSSQATHRTIASPHSISQYVRDTSWQKDLASHVASMTEVPSGKSARLPNAIENLIFGELKGYYLMELYQNKVSEMVLKKMEVGDAPQIQGQEVAFLKRNHDLWWIHFADLVIQEQSKAMSVIKLMNEDQTPVGKALFHWDAGGRLLSLKIERL